LYFKFVSPYQLFAFCPVGAGAHSFRIKWLGHEADHLLPPSIKDENAWSLTPMVWCLGT